MLKPIFSIMLIALCLTSCSQLTNEQKMVNTTHQLMSYLQKCDTLSIAKLYFRDNETLRNSEQFKEFSKNLTRDCKLYNQVISKYGTPNEKDFILYNNPDGGHKVIVNLVTNKDTTLNDYCKLIVQFYPFNLADPSKIFGSHIETTSELKTPKIIKADPFKN
jgi:hypothetical protein